MIKGVKVLFKVALGVLHIMKKQIMDCKDFANMFQILEQYPKTSIEPDLMMYVVQKTKLKNKEINKLRKKMREVVEKDLQSMVQQKESIQNGPYPKLNFINKFFLYNGLSKFNEQHEIFYKSMDLFEKELMEIFNCDTSWPICLFDFTYKNKVPNFVIFKIERELTECIIDNYMGEEHKQNYQVGNVS